MSKIYFVTLAKDTKSPFAPQQRRGEDQGRRAPSRPTPSGRRTQAPKKADEPKKDEAKKDAVPGRQGRPRRHRHPHRRPPDAGRRTTGALRSVGNRLYYGRAGTREPARDSTSTTSRSRPRPQLGDGRRLRDLGRRQEDARRRRAAATRSSTRRRRSSRSNDYLDLGDLKVTVDRHAEWKQIFNESWRQMRDFFYAPNMHGVDWPADAGQVRAARRARQPPGRPDLRHRRDDRRAELGPHLRRRRRPAAGSTRIPMGLLGARLERDPASKFFRIAKILKGQNWDPALRSPLTEIGVERQGGRLHRRVDGRSTAELTDIWEALVGKAGKQVTLKVNGTPSAQGARDVGGHPDRRRARPLLLQLGAGEHREGHEGHRTAASATSTSPTWACPA